MARTFIFVSSFDPEAARQAVLQSPLEVDLALISPSEAARETVGYAVDGRWVLTQEEPLLGPRAFAESGADVLARLVHVMRGLAAHDAQAPIVVLDGLDVLGATTFTLDEEGLVRFADDLEALLPPP